MTTIRACKPGDIITPASGSPRTNTYGEILAFFNLVSYDNGVVVATVCRVKDQDGVVKHLHGVQLDWECRVADGLCDCGATIVHNHNGLWDFEAGLGICDECRIEDEARIRAEIALDREQMEAYDAMLAADDFDTAGWFDADSDVAEMVPF